MSKSLLLLPLWVVAMIGTFAFNIAGYEYGMGLIFGLYIGWVVLVVS
jgi:uncharacterized membrane protein